MSRNLTWQVLRGVYANLSQAMPLALGEMYFATDTGNLYFGTPGVGPGYIQLGDILAVNETLQQILQELKMLKLAVISTDSGLLPQDFEVASGQIRNGDAVGEIE